MLYFTFGMVNTAGNGYQGSMAAVGNLGLKKIIEGWDINADASHIAKRAEQYRIVHYEQLQLWRLRAQTFRRIYLLDGIRAACAIGNHPTRRLQYEQ